MNVKEVFKRKIAVKTKYSIHGAVDRKTAAQVNSRQFLHPTPPPISLKRQQSPVPVLHTIVSM